jgi:hypothetical protein
MIPKKRRLVIYKKMITLLESPIDRIDTKRRDCTEIHNWGYCWLLIVIYEQDNLSHKILITNLPELIAYCPKSIDPNNNIFWFATMGSEGIEHRLDILKEIVSNMESKKTK